MITVQIRDSKNVPETFPQLYQLFEKWYTERGKKVPEQRHFIRKMREELGVEMRDYLFLRIFKISEVRHHADVWFFAIKIFKKLL